MGKNVHIVYGWAIKGGKGIQRLAWSLQRREKQSSEEPQLPGYASPSLGGRRAPRVVRSPA